MVAEKKTPGYRVVSQGTNPDFWPKKLVKNGTNGEAKRTGWKGKEKGKQKGKG